MYGHYNETIKQQQLNEQFQYPNQQYSMNKDDYLTIKNTQQCLNNQKNNLQCLSTKEELNLLNNSLMQSNQSSNLVQIDACNQQQILNTQRQLTNPSDQWTVNNYYDQSTYSLIPSDSQNLNLISNQPNVQTNLLSNMPSTNAQASMEPNIQPNVQSNIQTILNTVNSSNLQTNIQQPVQTPIQHQYSNQSSNQLSSNLKPVQSAKQFTTFNDYSNKDQLFLDGKIKTEKTINFNPNFNRQTNLSHNHSSNIQTNYLQINHFPCDLPPPYSSVNQQQINSNDNFNLLPSNEAVSLSSLADYIPESIVSVNQASYQQPIKSDQIEYTNLNTNNNLNSLNSLPPDEFNTHEKKLIENDNSQPIIPTCLSYQTSNLQPINSVIHSLNSSGNYSMNSSLNSSYSTQQLTSIPSQSTAHHLPNSQLSDSKNLENFNTNQQLISNFNPNQIRPVRPIKQIGNQNKSPHNSMKSQKSLNVSFKLKNSIQSRLQNQLPLNNTIKNKLNLSLNSNKLVDKKEVPNLIKLNSNKLNQNRSTKLAGVILDEEEKKRRRRERNKLAATKCRNRKKLHVTNLSQESIDFDKKNQSLRKEIEILRFEEQRLVQILRSHKTICHLKFELNDYEFEQIYQTSQFSQNLVSDNFNQLMVSSNNNQIAFKPNNPRIKIEPDYDRNSLNHTQFLNQQSNIYESANLPSTNHQIIKGFDYNYQSNQTTNLSNQNYQQGCYNSSQAYSSSSVNFDQFNSTNYQSTSSFSKVPPDLSSNLTNVDFLCTNDETSPNDSDMFSVGLL